MHLPTIKPEGAEVLYKDELNTEENETYEELADRINSDPTKFYSINLLSATYFNWDGSTTTKIENAEHKQKFAGTYTYYIEDVTTGQVIAQSHVFTIKQSTMTMTSSVDKEVVFIDVENPVVITYEAIWQGIVEGEYYKAEGTKTVNEEDYNAFNSTLGLSKKIPHDTPKDDLNLLFKNNYSNYSDIDLNYVILPQATVGSTYYGTLMQALEKASSGTVTALQSVTYEGTTYLSGSGFKHVINRPAQVKSGVTLFIPYDASTEITNENEDSSNLKNLITGSNKDAHMTTFNQTGYLKNLVSVSSNLDNYGTIAIAAQITGGSGGRSMNSIVSGNYAELRMGSGATINNKSGGNIKCYGFITEVSGSITTPQVICEDGSNMTVVFSFVEHRGGTVFTEMAGGTINVGLNRINMATSPFNQFFIQSIMTELVVRSGAKVNSFVVINISNSNCTDTIEMFGSSNTCFIQTLSETEIKFKYDAFNGYNHMQIYGDAYMNSLAVTITMLGMDRTLPTKDIYLPLSHYWYIDLYANNGNTSIVNIPQQAIRMLPGSKMIVHENVELIVNKLAVYGSDITIPTAGGFVYPTNEPAKLIVKGTLNVTTAFGGYVQTEDSGALFKTASVELTGDNAPKEWNADDSGATAVTLKAKADILDANDSVLENEELTFASAYYHGIDNAWLKPKATVTLDANGGTGGANSVVVDVTPNGLADITQLTAASVLPSRDGYKFGGWYFEDGTLFNADSASRIKYDTTLKAHWNKIFTIHFNTNGGNEISDITVVLNEDNILEEINDNIPFKTGFAFTGWYIDEAATQTKVSEGDFTDESASEITVFAGWGELKNPVTITVDGGTYNGTATNATFVEFDVEKDAEFIVPYTSYKTDSDYNVPYYLAGWKLPDGTVTALGQEIKTTEAITLTAHWASKVCVTVDASGSDGLTALGVKNVYLNTVLGQTTYDLEASFSNSELTSQDNAPDVKKYFGGWSATGVGTLNGTVITINDGVTEGTVTVKATWNDKTIQVTYNTNGGSCASSSAYYYSTALKLPTPTRTGYNFNGWYTAASGGTRIGGADANYTPTTSITLYAQWTGCTVTYNANSGSCSTASQTYSGTALTLPTPTRSNYTFNGWYTAASGGTKIGDAGASYTPTADITLYAHWTYSGGCLFEGTLITLADGTQKPIEDLTMNDMLLVFNHEAGNVEPGMIIMLDHLEIERQWFRVVNLAFSNGELLRIHNVHGLFDLTLNEYIFITEENMNNYVGHEFYSIYYDGTEFVSEIVTMTDAYITEEFTKIYCPLTAVHMNHFASGILSFTPAPYNIMTGHTNIFEYGDDLKYDEAKKQADIEKYGLFTYEELSEYITEEQFNALPFGYFKVSIGKGLMTWEEMIYCIEYVMGSASS